MMWRLRVSRPDSIFLPAVRGGVLYGDYLVDIVNAPKRIDLVGLDEASCGGSLCMSALLSRVLDELERGNNGRFNDSFCADALKQDPYDVSYESIRSGYDAAAKPFLGSTGSRLWCSFDEYAGDLVRGMLSDRCMYVWLLMRAGYEVSFEEV